MQNTVGSNMGSSTMHDTKADKAHAGIDRFSESAHHTVDRLVSAASSAADSMAKSKYAHMAQDWKAQTCDYVKAHPMTAVGIAVAAGFLLSRLTRH
jgi:ElaB/YqjD/DUF883 family membrane-anchored ribosome-binding protein